MKNFSIKHVPNILTCVRLFIVPFMGYYIATGKQPNHLLIGGILLVISGLTDYLDGLIARRCNAVSNFGKVVDPVADKLIQFTCMIALYIYGIVPLALPALIFIKEFLMGLGGLLLYKKRNLIKGSAWYGRFATVTFYVAVYYVVILSVIVDRWISWDASGKAYSTVLSDFIMSFREISIYVVMVISVFVALFAFVMYLREYIRIRKSFAAAEKLPENAAASKKIIKN